MHSTAAGAELPLFPIMKVDLSRRDKRNYRFHELKNGLRLLLVSDSANGLKQDDSLNPVSLPTSESAVAICINAGSFNDPDVAPGLSNLLAHVLLAEYNSYSGTNFGENAKDCKIKTGSYVTYEYSCFFFELEPDRIRACLELFAKTLTKPLLPEKLINAQIDEIDNDYRRCKLREYAMLQQFVCHLSTEDSPFNRFHKGNGESLRGNPERTVTQIRDMLLNYFNAFYCAHLMTFAIQSTHTLNELESMTLELFGKFPHRKSPIEKPRYLVDPFQNPRFQRLYEVATNRGKDGLRLIWSCRSLRAEYESNPMLVLSELIRNMNEGGLGHYLEDNHLATDLECDFGTLSELTNSSMCTLVVVRMNLTETGTRRIPEICGYVYDYLKFLNQLASESLSDNASAAWDFLDKDSAHTFSTYVRELQVTQEERFIDRLVLPAVVTTVWLANMLHRAKVEHVYSAYSLIKKQNIKLFCDILTDLSKKKACIIHSVTNMHPADESDDSFQVEPWLGLQYRANNDIYDKINWRCLQSDPLVTFSLPARNRCIVEAFNKLPCSNEIKLPEDLNAKPERMAYRDYGAMWFQSIVRFHRPTAVFYARFSSGASLESLKSSCLLLLYVEDVRRNLERINERLKGDDMQYSVEAVDNVIELRVSGSSEHIRDYYNTILSTAFKWSTNMEPMEFEELRGKIRTRLQSAIYDLAQYSQNIFHCVLHKPSFPLAEQLENLGRIALSDLMAFSTQFLAQVCVKAYGAGDIEPEEIQSMFDRTIRSLRCIPIISAKKIKIANIPPGTYYVERDCCNPSCKIVHFERYNISRDQSPRTRAYSRVLVAFLNKELAAFLRVPDNPGLRVFTRYLRSESATSDRFAISLCVQLNSESRLCALLEHLVSAFWYCVVPHSLASMDNDLLHKYKEQVVASLKMRTEKLDDYIEDNWDNIIYDEANFNKSREMIDCLKGITNYEIARFFCEHYLSPDNQRSIIVRISGDSKTNTWTRNPTGNVVNISGSGTSKSERKMIDSLIHQHFQSARIDVMALKKYPELHSASTSGFPEHIRHINDFNHFK